MPSTVRVAIPTTAGPVGVERIAPAPMRASRVFAWRGAAPLPGLSAGYDAFVRKRVARLFPPGAAPVFRLDLSGEIDSGESWQLAVFAAHALEAAGRLAGRAEAAEASALLLATGTVRHDMSAGDVGFVEDKLRLILHDPALAAAAAAGTRVIVALPEANAAEGRPEQERLRTLGAEVLAVRTVDELLARLGLHARPRGPGAEDAWEGSPFRGLEVFDVAHSRIFWGRGRARDEALQLLRRHGRAGCAFLLIHGSSGVGKSSLARAGLLADLAASGSGNDAWLTAAVMPGRGGRRPLAALAEVLAAAVPGLGEGLKGQMQADPAVAAWSVADALRPGTAGVRTRLALLVDQLEGLLLWAREAGTPAAAAEREAFATVLSRLARTGAVSVVATLRSDLVPLLEDSPALSDLARDDRLYRLERPRPGALHEIIRRPAELAGIRFSGQDADAIPLVDVLADAATGQQDCLPLLQFALKRLHDEAPGPDRTITFAQYQRLGGLENAIGTWAEDTVAALGSGAVDAEAVDDVLFNLARRGRGTGVVVGAELVLDAAFATPVRERVIAALAQARLLVLDADPATRRRTVRVAHEALLTHWRRARTLFETHGTKLALKEELERGAARWHDQGRADGFLVLGAARVAEAEALLSDRRVSLSDGTRAYVAASVAGRRAALEGIRTRLARDEAKVGSLLAAGAFGEAERELDRVCGYLAEDTDPGLRERHARLAAQLGRVRRLAAYDAAARLVFPLAGQEEFEQARLACHAALTALDVLDDAAWWDSLPVTDLSGEQAAALRQDIYRLLLLGSGLELVPGIRSLFRGRASSPGKGRGPGLRRLLGLVPRPVLAAAVRRGGIGPFRLPGRQDDAEARAAFGRCLAALRAAGRAESAQGSPPSRTGVLVSGIAAMLSDLADGPAGAPISYGTWLASRRNAAEPVNAADHFFVALFNYFIAKRGGSGGVARFLALVQDGFPDLDARAPLRTAERLLRAAVALEPRNFWPHWLLGRTLLEAGAAEAAELAFNAAIAVDPAYARGYEQRALALAAQWRQGRDARLHARARADSQQAGQLAGGDPSVFWPRGELLEGLGATADALDAYSLWLEHEENLLGTVSRGAGVARLFRLATRLAASRRGLGLRADALALLALVHWTWGDHRTALGAAQAALRAAPGHHHGLAALGAALRGLGDSRRALAEGLDPVLAGYRATPFVLLTRARALDDLGHPGAAPAWDAVLGAAAGMAQDAPPPWMLALARQRLRPPC